MHGRRGETILRERGALVVGERLGRETRAIAERGDLVDRQAARDLEHAERRGARRVGAGGEAGGGALAQRVMEQHADRGAIAGTGEPVRERPVTQGIGGGADAPIEILEDLDHGGQSGSRSHAGRLA